QRPEAENHVATHYSVLNYWHKLASHDRNPPRWNLFQLLSIGANLSDPFFALNAVNRTNGAMYFYLYNQNSKTSYSQTIKDIPDGKWFRVEAFYRCAGDNTGQVTFW